MGTKAAFSIWEDRVAPVFDVARRVRIVEADSGRVVAAADESLPEDAPAVRARRLADLGVATLVCGAISRPVQDAVAAFGIRVVPFVAGDLGEVVEAWMAGRLDGVRFAMPGCGGKRRGRFRGGRGAGGGPGGSCVCPRCGRREPHARGTPCAATSCPECGTAMRRE